MMLDIKSIDFNDSLSFHFEKDQLIVTSTPKLKEDKNGWIDHHHHEISFLDARKIINFLLSELNKKEQI